MIISKIYDDTQVSLIPDNATAAAGYVDGSWQTYPVLVKRFGSRIPLISITVFGNHARICDIEPGNPMTDTEVPGWTAAMVRAGVYRPGPYTSASSVDTLASLITRAGLQRDQYVIWSAHYTGVAHICGPTTCGACRTACDATQYTNHANGESLDETAAEPWFLSGAASPDWTQQMISNLPTMSEGANTGLAFLVFRLQGELVGAGKHKNIDAAEKLTIDGVFGAQTTLAVREVQQNYGLAQDGVVGPATWTVLVTGQSG